MQRPLMIITRLAILLTPMLAGADDQGWMPSEWNPTPAAQPSVELVQLVQLLEARGVITDQEYAQLIQPRLSGPARQEQVRVWTWDEIDHNPMLCAGGSSAD